VLARTTKGEKKKKKKNLKVVDIIFEGGTNTPPTTE
jgi:hypothetical protein